MPVYGYMYGDVTIHNIAEHNIKININTPNMQKFEGK